MNVVPLRALQVLGRAEARDTWGAAWLYAAAALVIAVGSAVPEHSVATLMAILACLLAGVAIVGPGSVIAGSISRRSLVTVLVTAMVLMLLGNVVMPPVDGPAYLLALVAASALGTVGLLLDRGRGSMLVAIALVAQFGLACWMIAAVEVPDIDVHMFQQQGAAALLSGSNPYSLRYENTAGYGTWIYALELQVGDRLAFGFPYPPLSLLMAIPGYVIAGDYRYGAAGSILVSSLIIWRLRPGSVASGAALLLAFSPLTFRVLYRGWTEPFVGLWLVITLFLASKLAAGTPVALGLLVATKQYVLPVMLLAPLLLADLERRMSWRRLTGVAVLVAGSTILPFLLWHPGDLLFSVVVVQTLQPLRLDSASVPGALARLGWAAPPQWLAFLVAGVGILLVALRTPRTPAGLAAAVAFVFTLFFLFSKQAFGNYYFFPLVALVCAIALAAPTASGDGAEGPSKRARPMRAGYR